MFLVCEAAHAASTRAPRSRGFPRPVRPLLRFPALSSFPGHILAQEARWCALGKRLMSVPISARISSPVLGPTPGSVPRRLSSPSKGRMHSAISASSLAISWSRKSTCLNWVSRSIRWCAPSIPQRARSNSPRFFFSRPRAKAASLEGSSSPRTSASSIALPETPNTLVATSRA